MRLVLDAKTAVRVLRVREIIELNRALDVTEHLLLHEAVATAIAAPHQRDVTS